MKKKLLFTAYSLGLGGIEKALINLLNKLDYDRYDVTLILEKKDGMFLDMVPPLVKVKEYKISDNKIVILRKIYNRLKLIWWRIKLHKSYDFSCAFTTYSIPCAHLALAGSNNSTLWVHNNYHIVYPNDKDLKEFLDGVMTQKFKRVVFVSKDNKDDVCKHYSGIKEKSLVCNNFIDGELILARSLEKIDFRRSKNPLFINVGRHDEFQKRLTRIIDASKRLVKEGYRFQVMFIGDGSDSLMYEELIKGDNLENVILIMGSQKNPYPYYKIADAVLLSSEFEGYPVVFLEAMIMDKPILSTKVSDYEALDGMYGMFCEKDTDSVYKMMKKYLDDGFSIKEKFDYQKFNKEIEEKIDNMINN